jgi:small subunit ribosomal protein S2
MSLLTRIIADAAAEGLMARSAGKSGEQPAEAEPMPDWERELLEGDGAKPEDKTEAKAEEPKAEAKKADEAEKSN